MVRLESYWYNTPEYSPELLDSDATNTRDLVWSPVKEAEIVKLVESYKTTLSQITADKLIHIFRPLLLKWVKFLTSYANCPDLPFQRFLQSYIFRKVPGSLRNRHRLFVDSLRAYEKDDIFSEICIAFLETCIKSENIVYGIPHFLSHRIYNLIKDPLIFGQRCDFLDWAIQPDNYLSAQDDYHSSTPWDTKRTSTLDIYAEEIKALKDSKVEVGDSFGALFSNIDDLIIVKTREDGLLGITLNPDWLSGKTVGLGNVPEFLELTKIDRELLLRHYLIKQTHRDIARDMNWTEGQVNRQVPRAKKRLKEAFERTRPKYLGD